MRITSGYGVEILKLHKPLGKTLRVCREAVDWLYPVIDTEWDGLSGIRWEKQRFNAAEKLIHTTKRNKAKYACSMCSGLFPPRGHEVRKAGKLRLPPEPLPEKRNMQKAVRAYPITICRFFTGTTCTGRKRTGYS